MEILGIVEGITSEGHALVKCVNLPDLGTAVFDAERNRVGTVRRVLGPVDEPYASISGEGMRPALKGKKLFFNPSGNDGRNKRKGRKN
ncbi:MAG: Gar1/Naf1 family protein [archaeon]|nr:Gar1/Naf1 family protein [archaeon]